jgi:hypothetical protein
VEGDNDEDKDDGNKDEEGTRMTPHRYSGPPTTRLHRLQVVDSRVRRRRQEDDTGRATATDDDDYGGGRQDINNGEDGGQQRQRRQRGANNGNEPRPQTPRPSSTPTTASNCSQGGRWVLRSTTMTTRGKECGGRRNDNEGKRKTGRGGRGMSE